MLLADDDRVVDELVEERDLLGACCFVVAGADEEEDLVSLCDALRVSYQREIPSVHASNKNMNKHTYDSL